jgi:hypothetical protein|nr:MAG TPA: hypothetical protein [Caudoviricetes sp.]
MKLSDLKLSEIRKIYYVEIKGNIEEITVYNLFGEERQQLKNMVTKEMEEDTTGKDLMNLIYEKAFNLATDIEIDDELIDSINKGNKELMLIAQDVEEIVGEIVMEVLLEKQLLIEQMQSLALTKKILLETEKLDLINRDCEKLEGEIKEMKKGD